MKINFPDSEHFYLSTTAKINSVEADFQPQYRNDDKVVRAADLVLEALNSLLLELLNC